MIFLKKLEKIFKMNTIAVVGMSPKIERPSHYVSQYMIENGSSNFIEIGPGKVLSGLVKRIDRTVKVNAINNEEDISSIKNRNELQK